MLPQVDASVEGGSMAFTFRLPVRYGSIDFARIVYYPQFLHFCHVAMEEMFAAVVGVSYPDALQKEKVGYPTVKSEADFIEPVAYGEELAMSVAVERMGTSSIVFVYEGRRSSDGELAFRVRNTQVAVDMDAWKSTPIPTHHRQAFETLQDATDA
jgi:YbgC/YbaW family acyl-CoA thioester hydrolase